MPRHGPGAYRYGHRGPRRPPGGDWQRFGRIMFLRIAFVVAMGVMAVVLFTAGFVAFFTRVGSPAVFAMVLLVATLLVAGRTLGRAFGRTWAPVRQLIAALGTLAEGDYSTRVPEDAPGPMRPVAASFNAMARRLEESDEQRRRLLADLGHELRTPLTVVRGEVEALVDGVHPPDPEHLGILLDEVAVLERLIDDLRTLSLAEAGALTLHEEPTDIGALVSDVADAHRRGAEAAGIEIVVDAPGNAPEIAVDPVRIRAVVSNLVVNAIRAMPDGGRLTLSVRREGATTAIRVTDTGVGIPAGELERVFDRFHRGGGSTGSGLGLTISRDVVRAHGGTIDIASTEGVGSVVTVRLPS